MDIQRVGVLGGGLMGAGIAYVTVNSARLPTRLRDVTQHGTSYALNYAYRQYQTKLKRGFMKPVE